MLYPALLYQNDIPSGSWYNKVFMKLKHIIQFKNVIACNIDNNDNYAVHYNLIPGATQISGSRMIYNIMSGPDKSTKTQYDSRRKRQ